MHKCRVPGCTSVSQLIRFPRDEDQLRTWISAVQNPVLENMSIGLLYKIERICVDHFEDKCFSNESTITNKILLDDVVPTLSLPGSKLNIKCIAHQNSSNISSSGNQNQVVTNQFAKRLKETILNLPSLDRICVLLFKTIKLSPKLVYNSNYDMIFGWQNVNTNHKNAFAKKAIVFMVRGLYSNWKQMISFVFCDDEIEEHILIQSIKDVINTCFTLRLKIVATVCEETKFNVAAMNSFAQKSHETCLHDEKEFGYKSFTVNNHEIIILYDVLHLFKSIQNEFSKNDFQFKIDEHEYVASCKTVLKSKKHHLYKDYFKIITYANNGTRKFMEFFIQLFNSLDGSSKRTELNHLKINVTFTSEHWDLWVRSAEILQNMTNVEGAPSCVQQWSITLYGIMHLWRGILQRSNFKSFSPRFLQLRELNKVVFKIRSNRKEPIRYMDYDEISYSKYLKKISYKIKSKKYTKKLNCNTFVKLFKNEIINIQDNSLPLCDATRPLLFEKIQQFTDKDFNDYDYRNLDQGMTKYSKPLLSAPEFFEFYYDPILYFENSALNNWTLNKNQILKILPLNNIKNAVATDMSFVLKNNNCNDCNKMNCDDVSLNMQYSNFTKAFAQIILVIITELPKKYNIPEISSNLSEACNTLCDIEYINCTQHNLANIFIKCCIHYVIKFWILKINKCLRKKCNFNSSMDIITKQAILIGKNRKNILNGKKRKFKWV